MDAKSEGERVCGFVLEMVADVKAVRVVVLVDLFRQWRWKQCVGSNQNQ